LEKSPQGEEGRGFIRRGGTHIITAAAGSQGRQGSWVNGGGGLKTAAEDGKEIVSRRRSVIGSMPRIDGGKRILTEEAQEIVGRTAERVKEGRGFIR